MWRSATVGLTSQILQFTECVSWEVLCYSQAAFTASRLNAISRHVKLEILSSMFAINMIADFHFHNHPALSSPDTTSICTRNIDSCQCMHVHNQNFNVAFANKLQGNYITVYKTTSACLWPLVQMLSKKALANVINEENYSHGVQVAELHFLSCILYVWDNLCTEFTLVLHTSFYVHNMHGSLAVARDVIYKDSKEFLIVQFLSAITC